MKNLSDIKSLFFYMLAYWTWKKNKQSVLPELFYVMPIDEIVKLVTIFGGRTLRVPTFRELSKELKEAMGSYMRFDLKMTHGKIRRVFKMNYDQYREMRKNIEDYGAYFSVALRKAYNVRPK